MARFLRDEQVSNVTVDAQAITQLVQAFRARASLLPEYTAAPAGQTPDLFLHFTIRFDEKGYRVTDLNDLLRHFEEATHVERIIFELHSGTSLKSNSVVGSSLSLRLDTEETPYFLTSNADDENWMNGSFAAVHDILTRHKNRYGWIRNAWVNVFIQLVGLLAGFVVSLWAATQIAPSLRIENAFLISFLLVLLVFSNLWGPINQKVHALVRFAFPNVKFYRPKKDRLEWLYQGIIVAIVGAAALYALNWAFVYVGKILGLFVSPTQ